MPDRPAITTAEQLAAFLKRYGKTGGILSVSGRLTWAELVEEAACRASSRRESCQGELIGMFGIPTLNTIREIFTAWASGSVPVLLNNHMPIETAVEQCRRIGCRFFVGDTQSADLEVIAPKARVQPLLHSRSDWASILFTSGSTGEPKACVNSFSNHFYSALGANENMPLEPADRWLLSLPLFHVGGLGVLFRTMLAGASVVIPPEPSLSASLDFAEPTHLSLVHTQLYRLMQDSATVDFLRRYRGILLGGSAFPDALIRQAVDEGIIIHTSYGSTEMSSQITATPRGASLAELLTCGRLLPYRSLHFTQDGEILVSGKTLFLGYWDGETLTRPENEGFFSTGDLGRLDENGNLLIYGRRDNLFKAGGENISPEEIERLLLRIEDVAEAIVVPIPDPEYGALPVAFIRTFSGKPANRLDLTSLRRTLPGLKIPRRVWDLPADQGRLKPSRSELSRLAEKLLLQEKA
ncbi:MAG: AMP-binding protein [candidate division KSB1 bacterium]|nr:AMP-binding protein [candidate division KSB1 bacterium]